jgi:hypothetical protein
VSYRPGNTVIYSAPELLQTIETYSTIYGTLEKPGFILKSWDFREGKSHFYNDKIYV